MTCIEAAKRLMDALIVDPDRVRIVITQLVRREWTQNIDAIPPAETKPTPRATRKDTRKRDGRVATQTDQVPSEYGQYPRPVFVVRPMRLDSFR